MRKVVNRVLVSVLLVLVQVGLVQFAFEQDAQAAKKALIYSGVGACSDGCYQAAFNIATMSGYDPVYVTGKELNSSTNDLDVSHLYQDVAVWIQPGGHSQQAMQNMTSQMVGALQAFVNNGGAYVGFCAGAFSSTLKVGTTSTLGFNFMPGKTILYGDRYNADIIPVTWEGKTRYLYWEGGPYISDIPAGAAEPMAYYPDGSIAAARSIYGKGRVYVSGVHPEAPQDWRDYYGLKDTDGLDWDIAQGMVEWATSSEVSGASGNGTTTASGSASSGSSSAAPGSAGESATGISANAPAVNPVIPISFSTISGRF